MEKSKEHIASEKVIAESQKALDALKKEADR